MHNNNNNNNNNNTYWISLSGNKYRERVEKMQINVSPKEFWFMVHEQEECYNVDKNMYW
jgi:hypothetical protein